MEQEIFDGTCPECAGDNIETMKNTIVGGKVRSQEMKCFRMRNLIHDLAESGYSS